MRTTIFDEKDENTETYCCRNVDGTSCVTGVRSSTYALDHVELRSSEHMGRKWTIFPRLDADQRCGSSESRILLLLARQRIEFVFFFLVLLGLLVVDQFR